MTANSLRRAFSLQRGCKSPFETAQGRMPPSFLLPFHVHSRNITTTTTEDVSSAPTPPPSSTLNATSAEPIHSTNAEPSQPPIPMPKGHRAPKPSTGSSPQYALHRAPAPPSSTSLPNNKETATATNTPLSLSPHLSAYLPHLAAQKPHYITIHLHGKPYLVTQGDVIRLPFLMHGVMPGDVLRLDRASVLGSREWTMRGGRGAPMASAAGFAGPNPAIPFRPGMDAEEELVAGVEATTIEPAVGNTDGLVETPTQATNTTAVKDRRNARAPTYINPRLFTCRATVLGVESEPLRIKEKTKRRQRKVKRVKSKHRYTMLRISEVTVNGLDEVLQS